MSRIVRDIRIRPQHSHLPDARVTLESNEVIAGYFTNWMTVFTGAATVSLEMTPQTARKFAALLTEFADETDALIKKMEGEAHAKNHNITI